MAWKIYNRNPDAHHKRSAHTLPITELRSTKTGRLIVTLHLENFQSMEDGCFVSQVVFNNIYDE